MSGESPAWIEVGTVDELARKGRLLVTTEPDDIVVWWHDGAPHGLRNICIHRYRALADGSLLGDRVICPGHQWAFDIATGYCSARDTHQPVHATRVEDGTVYVDPAPTRPGEPGEPI